jgi:hypothetical protein
MSEGVWHQDAQSEGPSRNEDGWLVGRARGDVGSSASSEQQLVKSAMGASSEYRGITWHGRLQICL